MRILVVAPSWIGDTILAQPLLALLKRNRPAAVIDVLAPDWSAPLLARMDEVDAVIPIPSATATSVSVPVAPSAAASPRKGYAEAYVLPNSWKSALIPSSPAFPAHRLSGRGALPAAEPTPPAR
jgi:heptosyltransferase-2